MTSKENISLVVLCCVPQFALSESAFHSVLLGEENLGMRDPNTGQNWTIFHSLYEALKEKEHKGQRERRKLRLAKCASCGCATPYKSKSSEPVSFQCKKCGTLVLIFPKQ